jgi:hypothetical protein
LRVRSRWRPMRLLMRPQGGRVRFAGGHQRLMTESIVIADHCDVPVGPGSGRGLLPNRPIGSPALFVLGDARR